MVKFNAPLSMRKIGQGFLKMFADRIEDEDLIEGLEWFERECLPYIYYGEFIDDDTED